MHARVPVPTPVYPFSDGFRSEILGSSLARSCIVPVRYPPIRACWSGTVPSFAFTGFSEIRLQGPLVGPRVCTPPKVTSACLVGTYAGEGKRREIARCRHAVSPTDLSER